jgi:hypothetical protein
MPDVQVQLEDQVLGIIESMQLDWPPAGEVRARRLPWDVAGNGTVIVHRGITVYPVPEQYAAGTNEREDVGYGVGIAVIASADHATSENRNRVREVTAKIRRELVEDRLTVNLPGATYNQTKVRVGEVNIPKEAHRYEVSGLVVRCWVRESRT